MMTVRSFDFSRRFAAIFLRTFLFSILKKNRSIEPPSILNHFPQFQNSQLQSFPSHSTAGLKAPGGTRPQLGQPQERLHLAQVQCEGQVLFVGQDQDWNWVSLTHSQKFNFSLFDSVFSARIHNENDSIRASRVTFPQGSNLLLTTNVPNCERGSIRGSYLEQEIKILELDACVPKTQKEYSSGMINIFDNFTVGTSIHQVWKLAETRIQLRIFKNLHDD